MLTMAKRSSRAVRKRSDLASRSQHTFINAFDSELNWTAIAWRHNALQGTVFGHASRRQAELALERSLRLPPQLGRIVDDSQSNDLPHWVGQLIDNLRRYADGESVDFWAVPLDLSHLTSFARGVVAACRRIRWGQARTYGQLAAVCGSPGAARAVGSVMAKNRFPLIVPCHRVLAAGGALGGYSAPDGLQMKRRLLAMEGIVAFASFK